MLAVPASHRRITIPRPHHHPRSGARPPSRWRRWLVAAVGACVAGGAGLLAVGYALAPDLPTGRELQNPPLPVGSVAYTADGVVLARYFYEDRAWTSRDAIAPAVRHALVATEDHRFYGHGGVDLRRLVGAVWHTAVGDRQGGSTLTMQLARNLYPEVAHAPTLRRKLLELATAVRLERHYTKDELLELYLNTVPFGRGAFGIEAAARTYFQQPAAALGAAEAALLVGLLKGPSWYDPVRHPTRARQRRDLVLGQMAKRGYLPAAEAARLRQQPLGLDLATRRRAGGPAPHFAEHVRQWAAAWADAHGYDLYADGLRIHTTLDARLQRHATEAAQAQAEALHAVAAVEWSRPRPPWLGEVAAAYAQQRGGTEPFAHLWHAKPHLLDVHIRRTHRFRRRVATGTPEAAALAALRADGAFVDSLRRAVARLEVGLVALDPRTGHVKAWVGGRDFAQDQYDHVAQARRQPGSTFKPFLYATALDVGFSPYHRIPARPPEPAADGGPTDRRPLIGGGGLGSEPTTLLDGLTHSKNAVAARLIAAVGAEQVVRTARRLGITSPLRPVPSLALGTSEVTLLEMTSAYGTLAGGGVRRPPVVVTRIESADGRVLATFAPEPARALSAHTAYGTIDLMRHVVDHGTGAGIRARHGISADVAGKTGTTQRNADGWFLLAHPRLVTGAWVGFNDRRIAFRSDHWGQGGHNALDVVGAFFGRALADEALGLAGATFRPPPGYRAPTPEDVASLYADSTGLMPLLLERSAPPAQAPEPDAEQALRLRLQHAADSVRTPADASQVPGRNAEDALRRALEQE